MSEGDLADAARDAANYEAGWLKHEREQPFWKALDDFCEERGDDPQGLHQMQIELGISDADIENRRYQMSLQLDF